MKFMPTALNHVLLFESMMVLGGVCIYYLWAV